MFCTGLWYNWIGLGHKVAAKILLGTAGLVGVINGYWGAPGFLEDLPHAQRGEPEDGLLLWVSTLPLHSMRREVPTLQTWGPPMYV